MNTLFPSDAGLVAWSCGVKSCMNTLSPSDAVVAWVEMHEGDLLADRQLAVDGGKPFSIPCSSLGDRLAPFHGE